MNSSFESYLRAEGLAPRTVALYARIAARWKGDPVRWVRSELEECPAGTASVLKSCLRHHRSWKGQNPVELPRGRRKRRIQRHPLTEGELAEWYSGLRAESDPARVVLEVLPRTGMRVSELVEARRSDLLFQEGRWGLEVQGKGGHRRWVPFSRGARRCLEQYLGLSLDTVADGSPRYLFPGRFEGSHISANWTREVARRVADRIGVECSPHVLRHTWATRANRAKVSPSAIQAVLGHSSPMTTAIYIHADPLAVLEAVDAAEDLDAN